MFEVNYSDPEGARTAENPGHVEFSLQSQSCPNTCIILMILRMRCKCIQTSGPLLNNFTRPQPLGMEKYSVKISNMAFNCATTSLLQYHQNRTSNEARGKKSTYFPNGKEGICAGSRFGSQLTRVCAIVIGVSSTICSLASIRIYEVLTLPSCSHLGTVHSYISME